MYPSDALLIYSNQINVPLDETMRSALLRYVDLVLEANKSFNLTAITDVNDFIVKHIVDSLIGASEIPRGANVCDIGSGAGFPAVPLAIARKDISVTALDSTAKKINFVQSSANMLDISNLTAISGRAEEQKKLFGKFDAVTARAVSSLPVLLELSMPLLKTGGVFVAYKTDESELAGTTSAMKTLGAIHKNTKLCALPGGDRRAIIVFEKVAVTPPQYPRQYGVIKKKPL